MKTKKERIVTSTTKLRQSVEYTLRKQETYSPIARNIFSLIHYQIKRNSDTLFYIFKKDIENVTGEKTCTDDIKNGLSQLRETSLWINDIKLSANLIASWQQINGELFEVEMSEKLMKYFVDVQEAYTEYLLESMVSLKKKYSKRIYEILCGFKSKGYCICSVDKFKEWLFIKNLETDKDKYPRWVDFDRYVLLPAIKEINEITELHMNYSTGKKARKIDMIIFSFGIAKKPNNQLSLELDFEDEQNKYLTILETKYQLRKDQALAFLRTYDFESERSKLYDLWVRSLPSSLNKIENLGGYIASMYKL